MIPLLRRSPGRGLATAAVAAVALLPAACSDPVELSAPAEIVDASPTADARPSPQPSPSSAEASDPGATDTSAPAGPSEGAAGPVRVVTVGDVACDPDEPVTDTTCQQQATADLTARLDPGLVIGLGDLQYQEGTVEQFDGGWQQSWGRFSDRLLTVPGNHEWRDDLRGYDATFDADVPRAVRVGSWGIYLLDGTCDRADCEEQGRWLADRLAEDPGRCQLVAWHQPRVSSGTQEDPATDPMFQAAVAGRADVALAAHDHFYERFTRLGADLTFDDVGVRQFIVGTGGKSLYLFEREEAGSEKRVQDTFGVLELTLEQNAYAWRFVDVDDRVLDTGDDVCR